MNLKQGTGRSFAHHHSLEASPAQLYNLRCQAGKWQSVHVWHMIQACTRRIKHYAACSKPALQCFALRHIREHQILPPNLLLPGTSATKSCHCSQFCVDHACQLPPTSAIGAQDMHRHASTQKWSMRLEKPGDILKQTMLPGFL